MEDIHFGDFRLDARARELRRDGERVELAPAPVTLLYLLARWSGELVARTELYEALWPEGGVDTERLVNTYMAQIRRALGERGGEDRFIRTYPGRGYRFLVPTRSEPEAARVEAPRIEASVHPTSTGASRILLGAGAMTALLSVGAVLVLLAGLGKGPARPAEALSGELRVEYLTARQLLADPIPARRATAAPLFRHVAAEVDGFAPAHSGLARSLFWAGDLDGAVEAARSALALAPGDAFAHLILGSSLLARDWDWASAEDHLRRAVGADRENPAARVGLAFLLLSSGRRAEALDHLEQGRALDPASPVVTGDLGLLFHWAGAHHRALELCSRTVRVEPDATWGYACAARAAEALGRRKQGRAFRRLLQERGSESSPRSHLAEARRWAASGHVDQALDALEAAARAREPAFVALAADPDFRPLAGHPRFDALVHALRSGSAPADGPPPAAG